MIFSFQLKRNKINKIKTNNTQKIKILIYKNKVRKSIPWKTLMNKNKIKIISTLNSKVLEKMKIRNRNKKNKINLIKQRKIEIIIISSEIMIKIFFFLMFQIK